MLSKNTKMRTAFNVIYKNIVNKITAFYLWNRSKRPFLKKTDILYENRKRNEYTGTLILNTGTLILNTYLSVAIFMLRNSHTHTLSLTHTHIHKHTITLAFAY